MFTQDIIKAAVLPAAIIFFMLAGSHNAAALTCEVAPRDIPINLMYHGADISIHGESAIDDDLIIRITSAPTEAHMKYKGKAAGLFWMKMGDMIFKNVPSVYLLYTSRDMNHLLDETERVKNGIGFEAIKAGTELEGKSADAEASPARWIEEFIRFKSAEKLYQVKEGAIIRRHGENGNEYRLDAFWPYQAAPGTYTIETLAVREGRVVDRAATSLTVARSGVVAQLSGLAFNHAAIYGLIAIVVAMASGFAVGALFKKGGGAH